MPVDDLGVSDIPLSGIGGGEDNLNIGLCGWAQSLCHWFPDTHDGWHSR